MSEFTQTVPELVAWARKNDFSIALPPERLAFYCLLRCSTVSASTVK